jgi:hypothetical protein
VGPCDLANPNVKDEVLSKVRTYPNPTITNFDIELDEKIDLSILKSLVILDQNLVARWSTTSVPSRMISIPSTGWTSGTYYLQITLTNDIVSQKIQLKF